MVMMVKAPRRSPLLLSMAFQDACNSAAHSTNKITPRRMSASRQQGSSGAFEGDGLRPKSHHHNTMTAIFQAGAAGNCTWQCHSVWPEARYLRSNGVIGAPVAKASQAAADVSRSPANWFKAAANSCTYTCQLLRHSR